MRISPRLCHVCMLLYLKAWRSSDSCVIQYITYSCQVLWVTAKATINTATTICHWWEACTHTHMNAHFFPPYILHDLVSSSSMCFLPPPSLFPFSHTARYFPSHDHPALSLITSILIAPSAFLPHPPLPALSQLCLYTIASVDTIAFHLVTEMMCRCCYLLSDQEIYAMTTAEREWRQDVVWRVCACLWRGCVEETVGTTADKRVKYKQKQYSSIKKQRCCQVSSHLALCVCLFAHDET